MIHNVHQDLNSTEDSELRPQEQYAHHRIGIHQATVNWDTMG